MTIVGSTPPSSELSSSSSPPGSPVGEPAPGARVERPILAGFLIALSSSGFAAMGAGVRSLGDRIPATQVAFWRNFVGFLLVAAIMVVLRRRPRPRDRRGLFVRTIVGCFALVCSFEAISRAGLAMAVVLNNTSPLWVALLAPIILRERLTVRSVAAILVGFVGVLLLVGPGTAGLSLGVVLGLVSGFGAGIAYVMLRRLAATDDPFTVVVIFSGTSSLLLSPFLLVAPVWPSSWLDLVLVIGVGVGGTIGQLAMTAAFRHAGAAAVAGSKPVTVALASIFAVFVFGEILSARDVAGGVLVVAAAVYGLLWARR